MKQVEADGSGRRQTRRRQGRRRPEKLEEDAGADAEKETKPTYPW